MTCQRVLRYKCTVCGRAQPEMFDCKHSNTEDCSGIYTETGHLGRIECNVCDRKGNRDDLYKPKSFFSFMENILPHLFLRTVPFFIFIDLVQQFLVPKLQINL